MHGRFLAACLLALLVGCGKPKPAAPARGEATNANEAQTIALSAELTQLVRKYSVEQRRAPQSLDELVVKGYLSRVPQAPGGKRFAINKNLQVHVAD